MITPIGIMTKTIKLSVSIFEIRLKKKTDNDKYQMT